MGRHHLLSKKAFYLVGLICWSVIIGLLLLSPAKHLPPLFPHIDKVIHLGFFFAHGFLTYGVLINSALKENKRKCVYYSLIISMTFGVIIEILQNFIPGRTADIIDVIFNTAGTIIGINFKYLSSKNKQV